MDGTAEQKMVAQDQPVHLLSIIVREKLMKKVRKTIFFAE
jgi:hypothetical protein